MISLKAVTPAWKVITLLSCHLSLLTWKNFSHVLVEIIKIVEKECPFDGAFRHIKETS